MSVNGYDYEKQAWIVDDHYVRCGHPGEVCDCYGRQHEGELINEETAPRVTAQYVNAEAEYDQGESLPYFN